MPAPMLMHINHTVFLRDENLVLIDRRWLPLEIREVLCPDYEAVARAIEEMVVQGAGDIAITAGYGLFLAARHIENSRHPPEVARQLLLAAQDRLVDTRPTGYHLAALLGKMVAGLDWEQGDWSVQILERVNRAIGRQERRAELTGRWAETLLEDGDTILTHCFPGSALLHMLGQAGQKGKKVEVVATETRPYLQGARLTAWSVAELGVPVTLITDNMAAHCMSQGVLTKVFTAADRIALDGSVANKVGTFQLALAASYHHLPFYILGYGGPDAECLTGGDIPIEIREAQEVLSFRGVPLTSPAVRGFYPAFDITPPELIKGIVTDRGILAPGEVGRYRELPRDGNVDT